MRLGHGAGDVGKPKAIGLHLEALVTHGPADGLDDLAHGVRPGVGDPPAESGFGRGEFGAHDALHQVVDEHHRTPLASVAEHGESAGAHEREERRLACGLVWSVEPRGPHHHDVEATFGGVEDAQLAVHLRAAVAEVRVIRLVVAEACRTVRGSFRTGCSTTRAPCVARRDASAARAMFSVPR